MRFTIEAWFYKSSYKIVGEAIANSLIKSGLHESLDLHLIRNFCKDLTLDNSKIQIFLDSRTENHLVATIRNKINVRADIFSKHCKVYMLWQSCLSCEFIG
jgi:hypothetical protein